MQRNQGTWAEYWQKTTLRCGNIKATIWENVSEKGPFFATTFSRPFKDQTGEWRNGTSFGLNDLEALVIVPCGEHKGTRPEWHSLKGSVADVTYNEADTSNTVGLPNNHLSPKERA